MTRWHKLLAAMVLIGLACVPIAAFGQSGSDRPFKATLTGSATWLWPGVTPSNCSVVTTSTDAKGVATHLGTVAVSMSHCPAEPAYVIDGRITITAANGDVLEGRYDYDPTSTSRSIPISFTGGTGRFGTASGVGVLDFVVVQQFIPGCNPVPKPFPCFDFSIPWPWSATVEGTISY